MSEARSGGAADGAAPSGVRLAELVAALSLATDLGLGQPQEHVLRQTVIAARLADLAGFETGRLADVYYTSLLAWVGCVSDSYELAKWFGDDRQLRADSYAIDKAGLPLAWFMVSHVGAGGSPLRRITMIGRFLAGGSRDAADAMLTHCQSTGVLASELGLHSLEGTLGQAFERWDGKGVPAGCAGEAIDPVMRVVHIADEAEVFSRVGGAAAAVEVLQSRSGTEFDPDLVALASEQADALFADLDEAPAWDTVIDAIGGMGDELTEDELTTVLGALADYADVKSPAWAGHSRHVGELVAAAADRLGLPEHERRLATRAGLVHDIGSVGISTGIWDKRTALTVAEEERVRTHPYLSERVLARPAPLEAIGAVAGLHHERLDGSGYPRRVRGDDIPLTARLVAAADVLSALGAARPHRDARSPQEREAVLRDEVRAGRLDGEAVNAVLAAGGHRVRRRPALPAGLTPREAEVLELLVLGCPNKEIARRLDVSPRTVGSHIEHIYTKIGVSTRGAAAMYAMRHGLVRRGGGAR